MTEQANQSVDRPARILIVDDEPLNVDYLEQELESLGFLTETAADGLEALDRVGAAPPDLVLLDVMMPRMDGISVLRILKDDPETRLIPVVLMTALNAVEDRVRGIEAGADAFLSKPVDDRVLLARINTALTLKRAIDETVGELRSTSAHLERYGRQERDVAVLAVDWRPREASIPDEAVSFVARRQREAAEEGIRARGGLPSESDAGPLVAVFDGPDGRTRSIAALEAAFVSLGRASGDASSPVLVSAGIALGPTLVGSTRVSHGGEAQWVFGAEGKPVQRASDLATRAGAAGVLVSTEVAAVVSDRFGLESVGNGAYRVPAPTADRGGIDAAAPATADRRIRTILVTDIVGSTRTVERIGDRAWGELVAEHERATREELVPFGGEEIATTGDGFVASFDGPARAIRCALALVDRVASLGLTIRAGIHTGELESVAGSSQGIALNVATRIAARASPAEVLVSATTRELAAGSGLVFTDRGEHTLSGVSETKRLYTASRLTQPAEAAPAEFPAGLTAREVDVLRLIAVGLTDAEAAERLFLSVRTVNAHLRSIYRKLGVGSRAAAGRFAAEHGQL
jgi:DNA-binding NarL/FixJ family response regulator